MVVMVVVVIVIVVLVVVIVLTSMWKCMCCGLFVRESIIIQQVKQFFLLTEPENPSPSPQNPAIELRSEAL
jgi:hypothetical protein